MLLTHLEKHLINELWKNLSSVAKPVLLKRHCYLYFVGEDAKEVYFITHGLLMLTRLLNNRREVGHSILTGFNMFGQSEILNGSARQHQANVLSECRFWAVNAADFIKISQSSAVLAFGLAQLQSDRLQKSEKKLETLTSHNVKQRLFDTLIEIAKITGVEKNSHISIVPCPTHQDLATLVASSRETVSTIMGKLRKENVINFNRSELQILNPEYFNNTIVVKM